MRAISIKALIIFLLFHVAVLTQAKTPELIQKTVGTSDITPDRIEIEAPDIAENGAVVPVTIKKVKSDQGLHADEIWLFADSNENVIAHYKLNSATTASGLGTRIKMADSGTVYAVARLSDGRFISGQKDVKITIGGCGGGGGNKEK